MFVGKRVCLACFCFRNISGRKCVSGTAFVWVLIWKHIMFANSVRAVLVQDQLCSHADGPSPGFSVLLPFHDGSLQADNNRDSKLVTQNLTFVRPKQR